MSSAKQGVVLRTWAESVAGSISDPVKRLRFVRAVAPAANIWGDRRPLWRRRAAVAGIVLATTGALITFLYAESAVAPKPAPPAPAAVEPAHELPPAAVPAAGVWLVEHTAASDSYSNGLQVDNTFTIETTPRRYLAFSITDEGAPTERSEVAGIVFHGTESRQIPFEADHNESLKRIGESLLEYVQRHHSYHFVIDRFGRVHRVVAESGAADHAGYSAWADDRRLYVNLNQSFLGVAFEARTAGTEGEATMTAAQKRSAAMLVEMLRARYGIPASNCVTHAQVSVNPSNMRIGYHVDWAADFPFREIGLPDNYSLPLPSIALLGFECDAALRRLGVRTGVEAAESLLERRAGAARKTPAQFRQALRQGYRAKLAAVRHRGA